MSDVKDVAEATRVSITLLARREHSDFELRRKLRARDFEETVIEEAIQKLLATNLLSNNRFIENYIQSRSKKGYGPLRIQIELSARGIPSEMIEEHLKMNDNAWFAIARNAWKKKFKQNKPSTYKERATQMRFLQYRGFTSDQIEFILQSDNEHA